MPFIPSGSRKLEAVRDGPAPRVPWAALAEFVAGLGAIALMLIVLVRLLDVAGPVDVAAVAAVGGALAVLAPLLLRQRSALARAAREAAAEADRARTDFLTGLPNRLAADAALDALIRRGAALVDRASAGRVGSGTVVPFWHGAALLAIDLDEFKPVNDEAGHSEGDRLLVEIATVLRGACGPGDVPARTGGDEFAVLMTGRDAAEARTLARTVRDRLRAHRFEAGGRRFAVSGSLGLVRIRPGDTDAKAVRDAADRGAYAAKESGRDAVFELATLDAEPVRVDDADGPGAVAGGPDGNGVAGGGAARDGHPVPAVLARRAVALAPGTPDRMELRPDGRAVPLPAAEEHRYPTLVGGAALLVGPHVPLALALPPVRGASALRALERAAVRLAARRRSATTVLLEMPRRRDDSGDFAAAVDAVRGAGLRVGVVARSHALPDVGRLAGLELDELQLHVARAPGGTLEAYALLAGAHGWGLAVADAEDASGLGALADAGVGHASGPAIGEPGPPGAVRATLGTPLPKAAPGRAARAA